MAALAVVGVCGCSSDVSSVDTSPQKAGEVRLYAVDRYDGVRRLDPDTLDVLSTLDTGRRPHGIVASPDGRTLFITVETSNELLKVDLATNRIVGRTQVGPVPNEPAVSADGRYVYVPQRGGEQCTVVDVATMSVVKYLDAGREEHNAYTSADGSRIFVTSMGDEWIAVIDPISHQILEKIAVEGIPRPLALRSDLSGAYVALSGLNGFIELDLQSGAEVERLELPVPEGTPPPLLDTYTHGLLLTPDESELWVASYATDKVFGIGLPEKTVFAEIPVAGGPHWFALHPDGEPLYVSLERSGQVAAIHRGLRQVLTSRPVGRGPTRILAFRYPGPEPAPTTSVGEDG